MPGRRALSVALLAVLAACGHKVSSPGVTAGAVAPDLVCGEQLTTRVTVSGDGFTPMPTETLTTSRLVLPAVTLTRATDLAGAAAPGAAVPILDDPSNAASSLVHWTSSRQMAFDVVPSLGLAPGRYDVAVTNPDGKSAARWASALAVVPRPVVSTLDRLAICDAQRSQTVQLTGTGFLSVGGVVPVVTIGNMTNASFASVVPGGCVPLAGSFAEGPVLACTTLTVTMPANLFPPGDYLVTVTNPSPAACRSSDPVTLHVEAPPTVTGTVPITLCQGGGTLRVNGAGFTQAATVALDPVGNASLAVLQSASAAVNGAGTQITAIFGGGAVAPNLYDVVVDNHDGCSDAPPHQRITAVTGPVAFFADPEVVYTGISTTVTVYVTTLSWTTTPTVQVAPHGKGAPLVPFTPIPVPGHPNRAQIVIAANQLAAGAYDLYLNDSTGCGSVLPNAFTLTATTDVALRSVTPAFGWPGASTAVTIKRDTTAPAPNDRPFVATPRLFLNPTGSTASPAVQVVSVSFVDQATLTAVVPAGQPTGVYDLVVVNPDGTVGFLPGAFTVNPAAPPVVTAVTPSSLVASTTNTVGLTGTGFAFGAGTTPALTCRPSPLAGNPVPVTFSASSCSGGTCTATATVNASAAGIANGAICVLRVTNPDGSFFDYSALGVTNSSLNLGATNPGSPLGKARRALVAAAGNATPASRFLYAVGGDGGVAAAAAPFADAEVASVDAFGNMGGWSPVLASSLATARAFAASATLGRYVYVFGGTDGSVPLRSAERAMILDPAEVPALDIGDIYPADVGLDPGYWIYRLSAVFSGASLDNPGGESLPSDEVIIKVPSFTGKKIEVLLSWQPPRDALGVALPNVAGFNVYRTPAVNGASGTEVLLAFVPGGATRQYLDDGSVVPAAGARGPLPFGSLGRWAQLPALATDRQGHAGAVAFDPAGATTAYVYALLGRNGGGALATYEYLPVAIQPNGHQVAAAAWKAGASAVTAPRSLAGAWVADRTTTSLITGSTTWVYVGGGEQAQDVDGGKVTAGGDLGAFTGVQKFGTQRAGYGVCAANGQLFAFGGQGNAPTSDAISGRITAPPSLANWNSGGPFSLLSPRYLSGSAVQSAFIFLVGGQTPAGGANSTTELVIW